MTVIEVVKFKIKDGFSNDQFLKAADHVHTIVKKFPGYESRKIAKLGNGEWFDS